ncbi:unnamed protein product [Candidula unifasciata]|uniref:Uncharacterized protein n=1 Tax=Candidula unifasciata TaxID=100452 RepID=A0A8S3YGK3_9EUPU|nr:unnamed protein product [Candidula unifasciata]
MSTHPLTTRNTNSDTSSTVAGEARSNLHLRFSPSASVMLIQAGSTIVCLFLAHVAAHPDLLLSMDRRPAGQFCGHLLCHVIMGQMDEHILGLSLFNITLPNTRTKLASVSLFEPRAHVEQCKSPLINATGYIIRNLGHLALGFQNMVDCLNGSFLCQLDFVNVSGQPDNIIKSTSPADMCDHSGIDHRLDRMFVALDNLAVGFHADLAALQQESSDVRQILEALLGSVGFIDSQIQRYNGTQQK